MKIHALLCPSSKTIIEHYNNPRDSPSSTSIINPSSSSLISTGNGKNLLFETGSSASINSPSNSIINSSSLQSFQGKNSYFQHFRIKPKSSDMSNQGLMLLAQAACTRALLATATVATINQDGHQSKQIISKNVYYSTSNGSEDGIKPKRKRADTSQLSILRRAFQTSPFPSTEFRRRLAKMLGMTCRSVQIWFQNQRQMVRHNMQSIMSKTSSEISFSPKTSPITIMNHHSEGMNGILSREL